MVSPNARKNAKPPQKLKGMTEYRAALTRAAYERDPEKCLRVVLNIIDKAHDGDAVAMKIFAQSFMTKAPTEMQITHTSEKQLASKEDTERLIGFYESRGYTKAQAADMVLAGIEAMKVFSEEESEIDA